MAYVIHHPERGIYLGSFLGLGFWSKLDAGGQPSAVTFSSIDAAQKHMQEWRGGQLEGVAFTAVDADWGTFASMEACIKAGLDGWLDAYLPVANRLPA